MIKNSIKTIRSKWHGDMHDESENNMRYLKANNVYLKNINSYIINENLIK